jgi:hypothetical protein
LGASDDDIKELIFEALKTESPEYKPENFKPKVTFDPKELPEGALSISEWLDVDLDADSEQKLADVVQYIVDRGHNPTDGNFYWSPVVGYDNRVILPFRYQNQIVGNTARKVTDGKPKYLSDQHPHFVFNFDRQLEEQKYILVCEGPFDALAVGGVALLTNEIAEQQARIINSLGAEVIVIPDQDAAGLILFDRAAELDWSIAMPNWDPEIKDVADAVQRYGQLFVIVDAIKTAQRGQIKIKMAKQQQEHKLQRLEYDKENS